LPRIRATPSGLVCCPEPRLHMPAVVGGGGGEPAPDLLVVTAPLALREGPRIHRTMGAIMWIIAIRTHIRLVARHSMVLAAPILLHLRPATLPEVHPEGAIVLGVVRDAPAAHASAAVVLLLLPPIFWVADVTMEWHTVLAQSHGRGRGGRTATTDALAAVGLLGPGPACAPPVVACVAIEAAVI